MTLRARVMDSPSEVVLEQNAVECHECPAIYTGPEAMAVQNAEGDVCPADDAHLGTPMHVSTEPKGLENDEDYAVVSGPNAGTWQYPLEQ